MNESLKSCPFCGANADCIDENVPSGYYSFIVHCRICYATTRNFENYELAIEAWNKRALIQKWISVRDRLPTEEDCYLVYVKCEDGDSITILYYTVENEFAWMPVTHWMSLPEAPDVN